MLKKTYMFFLLIIFIAGVPVHKLVSQESNFVMPIPEIEQKLQYEEFHVFRARDARFANDIVKRCIFRWPDQKYLQVKMKRAPSGGHVTNNAPRYEIAAYELQKLFLEPDEYVVPPTYGRTMLVEDYQKYDIQAAATFKGADCVYFVLQCWLENVDTNFKLNKKRFNTDSTYARHLANMNIFSYLIEHTDSNKGNFLVSTLPEMPRIYSVDNGLAFGSQISRRGYEWRDMKVKKLPKSTVEKLRKITSQTLHEKLGVVAQYRIEEDELLTVTPTENKNSTKGITVSEQTVQLGLTEAEINAIDKRLNKLLKEIDDEKFSLF